MINNKPPLDQRMVCGRHEQAGYKILYRRIPFTGAFLDNNYDGDAPNLIHPSPYYTIDALPSHLMNDGHLNILSLNAQSINSKFDSILALLDIAKNQNVNFHVICIQESWLKEGSDMSLFQIDGYQCIFQVTQCSAHGGSVAYIESS